MQQLTLMPWLRVRPGEAMQVGDVIVQPVEELASALTDPRVASKVRAIAAMYRDAGVNGKEPALDGVAALTVGAGDCRLLSEQENKKIDECRAVLFLVCLAQSVHSWGPSAGHWVYTAENFHVFRHTFDLDDERFSDTAGVLVPQQTFGLRTSSTRYVRPGWVNRPVGLVYRRQVLSALESVRKRRPSVMRRLVQAAAIFRESYYNSSDLDLRARILLQAAAFELLLDTPEGEGRRKFKEVLERKLCVPGERRFRFMSARGHGRREEEKRPRLVLWADRFFMLRNTIIHGGTTMPRAFAFHGQHHLLISPLVFVALVERALASVLPKKHTPLPQHFVEWKVARQREGEGPKWAGFRLRRDYVPEGP